MYKKTGLKFEISYMYLHENISITLRALLQVVYFKKVFHFGSNPPKWWPNHNSEHYSNKEKGRDLAQFWRFEPK
jgi:hypothetical protein